MSDIVCGWPLQEVFLLPSPPVPELQVSDAHPPERDEGTGRPEEGSPPRLLQHTEGQHSERHWRRCPGAERGSQTFCSASAAGGHTHSRILLHEPEAPATLHQESHEEVPRGDRAHRARPRPDPQGGV